VGPAWQRLPADEDVVWQGDGEHADEPLWDKGQRGNVTDAKGMEPLAEWARHMRRADGVDALAWIAFPVKPE
jgi:hypothetical protein